MNYLRNITELWLYLRFYIDRYLVVLAKLLEKLSHPRCFHTSLLLHRTTSYFQTKLSGHLQQTFRLFLIWHLVNRKLIYHHPGRGRWGSKYTVSQSILLFAKFGKLADLQLWSSYRRWTKQIIFKKIPVQIDKHTNSSERTNKRTDRQISQGS